MPAPPPPGAQKRGGAGLKIAVVLAVVVVVVLAVVLLYMTGGKPQPTAGFSAPLIGGTPRNYTVTWSVTSTSQEQAISAYKVGMLMDGSQLAVPQYLVSNAIMYFGPSVQAILFDIQGPGKLTNGDSFMVYGMASGHAWEFRLLWSDNSVVQTQK